MHSSIIVRYGEIALKGTNRCFFEKKLISNIESSFKKHKIKCASINRRRGRILINTNKNCGCLRYVFGITSFSYAIRVRLDIKEIEKSCLKIVAGKLDKDKNFKVETNRANKKFNFNSLELNNRIGELIRTKTKAKVDLKNPDLSVGIEIADKAYIFIDKIKGIGGLPIGISKVCILIKNKDDILAGILAMKRGCQIIPVAYKKIDISLLKKFDPNLKLKIIANFKKIKDDVLVTGQSLNNLKQINNYLVLRPLIAYSKEEIKDKLNFYITL